MDYTIIKEPCLLYETFAMMSRYFSERPYRETADTLLERYGGVLSDAQRRQILEMLKEEGALVEFSGRIRIPEDRFFVSDEIIRELI